MSAGRLAPAKVNLALHVTGQRDDGYHILDSLVVFADVGDRLSVTASPELSLNVTGPRAAGVPVGPDNLVLRAAGLFTHRPGATITLEKHLPNAAGIGGGSADAAAALSALSELWALPLPEAGAILSLGADVPVCLAGRPTRMRGIGEHLDPVPPLPPLWCVLANPGVAVPTGPVFQGLARKDNPPMAAPAWQDFDGFIAWLAAQRNDLQPPALALAPVIGDVLAELKAAGCALARMSGSGATCFGLFATPDAAQEAATALTSAHPDWWVQAAAILR